MASSLELRIRPFEPGDAAFVTRLGAQAFREFSSAAGRSALHMALADPTRVATRGDVPVGFAVLTLEPRVPVVTAIAVREWARGRGVGARLLAALERLALRHGATGVSARTADFNLAALELFLRAGYRVSRRVPRYYRGRFDACELTKSLMRPSAGA